MPARISKLRKRRPFRAGECVTIPVTQIEYREGGNTLWIHGPQGNTVLRLKTKSGTITTNRCLNGGMSHSDIMIDGGIDICHAP